MVASFANVVRSRYGAEAGARYGACGAASAEYSAGRDALGRVLRRPSPETSTNYAFRPYKTAAPADAAGTRPLPYWLQGPRKAADPGSRSGAMKGIDTLVPGFEAALESIPGTLSAHRRLEKALEGGVFTPRMRAQIGLAVAQQIRCDYCQWVFACLAGKAGLTGEDIVFACAGTAI